MVDATDMLGVMVKVSDTLNIVVAVNTDMLKVVVEVNTDAVVKVINDILDTVVDDNTMLKIVVKFLINMLKW